MRGEEEVPGETDGEIGGEFLRWSSRKMPVGEEEDEVQEAKLATSSWSSMGSCGCRTAGRFRADAADEGEKEESEVPQRCSRGGPVGAGRICKRAPRDRRGDHRRSTMGSWTLGVEVAVANCQSSIGGSVSVRNTAGDCTRRNGTGNAEIGGNRRYCLHYDTVRCSGGFLVQRSAVMGVWWKLRCGWRGKVLVMGLGGLVGALAFWYGWWSRGRLSRGNDSRGRRRNWRSDQEVEGCR